MTQGMDEIQWHVQIHTLNIVSGLLILILRGMLLCRCNTIIKSNIKIIFICVPTHIIINTSLNQKEVNTMTQGMDEIQWHVSSRNNCT
jgi:hypothetical protein